MEKKLFKDDDWYISYREKNVIIQSCQPVLSKSAKYFCVNFAKPAILSKYLFISFKRRVHIFNMSVTYVQSLKLTA